MTYVYVTHDTFATRYWHTIYAQWVTGGNDLELPPATALEAQILYLHEAKNQRDVAGALYDMILYINILDARFAE